MINFLLIISLVCVLVFIYAIFYAIDENNLFNTKSLLTENARVIAKNKETLSGIHPITTYNGYGYSTRYVETVTIQYKITFELEPTATKKTFCLSKKQYEAIGINEFGYLTYNLEKFKAFEKI